MSKDTPYKMLRRAARRDYLRALVPTKSQVVGALLSGTVSLSLIVANPQITKLVSSKAGDERVMAKADSIHLKSRDYGSYDVAPSEWPDSYSYDGQETFPQKRSSVDSRLASGTKHGGYKDRGTQYGSYDVASNDRWHGSSADRNGWVDGGSYSVKPAKPSPQPKNKRSELNVRLASSTNDDWSPYITTARGMVYMPEPFKHGWRKA